MIVRATLGVACMLLIGSANAEGSAGSFRNYLIQHTGGDVYVKEPSITLQGKVKEVGPDFVCVEAAGATHCFLYSAINHTIEKDGALTIVLAD